MTAAFAALRWLHLASLMLLFGSALLLARLTVKVPELAIENRTLRRTRLICALLAFFSALAWLGFATAQMAGDAAAAIDPQSLWTALRDTEFGEVLALRLVVLAALGIALAARREILTAFCAAIALTLISLTSHAAEASPAHFTAIGVTIDALHLLSAGYWIGGLAVLAAVVALRPEAPRLYAALALFAQGGMIAVTLLLLSGMLNAASILLAGAGHDSRTYLGVLGAKVILTLVMIGLALFNHFRLMPRLARPDSRTILKGNIVWELALGMGVIALASLLGLLQPTL